MRKIAGHGQPATCGQILDEALAINGPMVVEAVVDPLEPPMPAKVKMDQALRFAESLARGEPDRMQILKAVAEDRIREMI